MVLFREVGRTAMILFSPWGGLICRHRLATRSSLTHDCEAESLPYNPAKRKFFACNSWLCKKTFPSQDKNDTAAKSASLSSLRACVFFQWPVSLSFSFFIFISLCLIFQGPAASQSFNVVEMCYRTVQVGLKYIRNTSTVLVCSDDFGNVCEVMTMKQQEIPLHKHVSENHQRH